MPPEHARTFGGGATETTLNPFVFFAMILASVLILVLPRKYATVPLLLIMFLVPLGQSVVLGGAHFLVSRIVILVGVVRLLGAKATSRGDVSAGGYNSIDTAFVWCTIFQAAAVMLLFRDGSAVINQVGFLIDVLGGYVVLRYLLQDESDLYRAMRWMAFLSVILAVCMVIEQMKLINVFAYIGGNRLIPEIRESKIRSQGVFQHALLAGTFAATLLPLFLLLWKNGGSKLAAFFGIAGSTVMTITSNSSTPLLTYVGGLLAICLWPIRQKMRTLRWGIVFGLMVSAVVMKAPVWFILARIDLTGGSSGYHRATLIDQFIKHFWDWWLIGVKETGSWGWDLWDTQNQYVTVGQTGGLAAFVLFLVMISRCFTRLGNARKIVEGDRHKEWTLWFLGAALFSHLVAFFGVNLFDQSRMNWFALLAMISAVTAPFLQKKDTEVVEEAPVDYEQSVSGRM